MNEIERLAARVNRGLDESDLLRLLSDVTEFAFEEVTERTPVAKDSAYIGPKGRLKMSNHRTVISTEFKGRVWNDHPLALIVHNPTKPHTISPKTPGGVLAFLGKSGSMVFIRGPVQHPGTKGQPWFTESLPAIEKRTQTQMQKAALILLAKVFKS